MKIGREINFQSWTFRDSFFFKWQPSLHSAVYSAVLPSYLMVFLKFIIIIIKYLEATFAQQRHKLLLVQYSTTPLPSSSSLWGNNCSSQRIFTCFNPGPPTCYRTLQRGWDSRIHRSLQLQTVSPPTRRRLHRKLFKRDEAQGGNFKSMRKKKMLKIKMVGHRLHLCQRSSLPPSSTCPLLGHI